MIAGKIAWWFACFCLLSIPLEGDGRLQVSRGGTVHRTPSAREARRRRLAHWDIRRRSIFSSSLSKQILTRESSGLSRPHSIHHKTCIYHLLNVPACFNAQDPFVRNRHFTPLRVRSASVSGAFHARWRNICPNTAL